MKNTVSVLLVFVHLLFQSSYAYGDVERLKLRKTKDQENKNYQTNELLKSALELSSFRHKILSQNMANINTPGYKADEVATPKEYSDLISGGRSNKKIKLKKTTSNHLDGAYTKSGKFASHKLEDPYEIKPNGNNVSLAQQMTKISQNQQDYSAALKGYNATNSLISTEHGK